MQNLPIVITATFTAEPAGGPLSLMLEELNFRPSIAFAPFNQVFQQLLDPASMLASNRNGVNVVLVRLEDWAGHDGAFSEAARGAIERNVADLIAALESDARNAGVPIIVAVGPLSLAAVSDSSFAGFCANVSRQLASTLAPLKNVYFLDGANILETWPVASYDDPHGAKLGHMPYTPEFYSALGMMLARRIYRIKTPPPKVIVLDCDQTLWKGVCGEDGAAGVEIDPPRRFLQEFMVAQHRAGVLLCIASKNNEADALGVFARRTEMPLRLEHIVAHRINWQRKSENIHSLAEEFNLGLDSFVFVDDDPVVCAEVEAACPEVLTVQLPADPLEIPRVLRNLWAFDHLKVTREDAGRTELYRQNLERERVRRRSSNFDAFLQSLELEVRIAPMQQDEIPRVSQLTHRTNQFNCTTVRRSEGEIETLAAKGYRTYVVEARDRFGDYGLIGVMIFACPGADLVVDTFLMSCRALGRGIEHQMVACLGKIAGEERLSHVVIPFTRTAKNQPALDFLNASLGKYRQEVAGGYRFIVPAAEASTLVFRPVSLEEAVAPPENAALTTAATNMPATHAWRRITNELCSPGQVLAVVKARQRKESQVTSAGAVPRDALERQLAQIWEDALQVRPIGIDDNFFELGGDSLMAVGVFAAMEKSFGKQLSLAMLFQAPTIGALAEALRNDGWEPAWSSLIPLRPNGTKPPLYCMHAAGGTVHFYADLARALGPDQPVYGLQALGLDRKRPRQDRVEDMAAHYIKEILTFQPEGPYYLAGSSFGGLVAYEMAQQLTRQGRQVAMLALFDTYGPGYPRYRRQGLLRKVIRVTERVHHHLHSILALGPKRWEYIAAKASKARRLARRHYRNRKNEIARNYYQSTGQELPEDLIRTQNAILVALESYVPTEYSGKLTLFRASRQPMGIYPDPALGWTPLAGGGLEIHEVPGFHGALTVDPHAPSLAKRLAVCLDETRRQKKLLRNDVGRDLQIPEKVL
jgi:FkbH-like protein